MSYPDSHKLSVTIWIAHSMTGQDHKTMTDSLCSFHDGQIVINCMSWFYDPVRHYLDSSFHDGAQYPTLWSCPSWNEHKLSVMVLWSCQWRTGYDPIRHEDTDHGTPFLYNHDGQDSWFYDPVCLTRYTQEWTKSWSIFQDTYGN